MSKPLHHRLDRHQVECTRLLRENAVRHSLYRAFSDFCEMAALSISNAIDRSQYDAREARYLQIAAGYERPELERFARMLSHVTLGLEEQRTDFLGRLFMALEMGNEVTGQFFTPFEVSRMMAQMSLHDLTSEQLAERGGFITVCEPACGAGGMCVAVADVLAELSLNYQVCCHVTAVDVDATAVHMAYIQLSLIGLPAIVVQGNSLTLETRAHWVTPAHVIGGWDLRLKSRSAARKIDPIALELHAEDARAAAPIPAESAEAARERVVTERLEQAEQMALF